MSYVPLKDRPPQQQADLMWGLLLIGDVIRRGWVERGTFEVHCDKVYANVAVLVAEAGVSKPDRERSVRAALRLMSWRESLAPPDYEIAKSLLGLAYDEMEWPG